MTKLQYLEDKCECRLLCVAVVIFHAKPGWVAFLLVVFFVC